MEFPHVLAAALVAASPASATPLAPQFGAIVGPPENWDSIGKHWRSQR